MKTYKEIKKALRKINLGVVRLYDGTFDVYFTDGTAKGNTFTKARGLDTLEEILKTNGGDRKC